MFVVAGMSTLAVCWYGSIRLRSAWSDPASAQTGSASAAGDAVATPAEAFFGLQPSLAEN
jgi:hypothetical protein